MMGADLEGRSGALTGTVLRGAAALAAAASFSAASFARASTSRLVGGNGGSLAWSKAGGSLRRGCPSTDPTLVCEEVWFSERLEKFDIPDEFEFRLTDNDCVDGRRGGSAGEVACSVDLLDGNGGGARPPRLGRTGALSTAWPFTGTVLVLRGRAGAAATLLAGRGGMEGLPLLWAAAVDCCDGGGGAGEGRPAGGGGGGGLLFTGLGVLKFFCWLRAAIRSARVVK